jgi:hypothetical protein
MCAFSGFLAARPAVCYRFPKGKSKKYECSAHYTGEDTDHIAAEHTGLWLLGAALFSLSVIP